MRSGPTHRGNEAVMTGTSRAGTTKVGRHARTARWQRAATAAVALSTLAATPSLAVAVDADSSVPTTQASAGSLTNLSHLDFLGDRVSPPVQDGHTTYRLADEPQIGVLWTYAEPTAAVAIAAWGAVPTTRRGTPTARVPTTPTT